MTKITAWKDKGAIVTGGSSGIGRATALALADAGARVLITGRNAQTLGEVAALSVNVEAMQADSAEADSAAGMVARATELWGRVDLVVNNAGAGQPLPVEAYDAEVIERMCRLNIVSPSLLVQAARAALGEVKGAVVNISTAVARNAAPGLAHYAATKAALEHLTRSWAVELAAEGIRVNAVAPGPVKTGALTGMMGLSPEVAEEVEAQEAAQMPLGRRGVTDDIVPWVLRLGGADADWVTGQVVTLDGGWSQRM